MRQHLLIAETTIAVNPIPDANGRRRRAPADAGDAVINEFNATGYAFVNEDNLIEFVEEQLKKNPTLKWYKYSPVEMFETEPSPMKRKPWNPDAGFFGNDPV